MERSLRVSGRLGRERFWGPGGRRVSGAVSLTKAKQGLKVGINPS